MCRGGKLVERELTHCDGDTSLLCGRVQAAVIFEDGSQPLLYQVEGSLLTFLTPLAWLSPLLRVPTLFGSGTALATGFHASRPVRSPAAVVSHREDR